MNACKSEYVSQGNSKHPTPARIIQHKTIRSFEGPADGQNNNCDTKETLYFVILTHEAKTALQITPSQLFLMIHSETNNPHQPII